jgi:hypothetical protein
VRKIEFDPEFTRTGPSQLLITGPAGYGKSSLCRWHWLQDEQGLIAGQERPLPVYVRLHQHQHGPIDSFEKTFLVPEVEELLNHSKQTGRGRMVRLYLDGLDEVPDRARQAQLVRLAQEGGKRYPELQMIFTARDHVWGRWLSQMPRLRIARLDPSQARQLASNWLLDSRELSTFYEELEGVPALADLMAVPLLATLIVNLYRQTRKLPATKARLYTLFVELLSGGWDAAKQLHRSGRFGPEDKITILTRLAALMQSVRRTETGEEGFRTAITATLASFQGRWRDLLDEILQDGLLVRSGSTLIFGHQSFQEYLAGRDLRNDPTGRKPKQTLRRFLEGDDWWQEVLVFYIGLSGAPQELETWIDRTAATARPANLGEFNARLRFLKTALKESFPGY